MTKCYVISWVVSWNRKKTLGKNSKNLNKLWTLVHNNVLVLVCSS